MGADLSLRRVFGCLYHFTMRVTRLLQLCSSGDAVMLAEPGEGWKLYRLLEAF